MTFPTDKQLTMHKVHKHAMMSWLEQNALVLFQGSSDPVKKQHANVDLDEETNKVRKLLLSYLNPDGVDGTNEDKAKWWEEERKLFRGRSESFIARMHPIQGYIQFSIWKGSVVDSVVGVFSLKMSQTIFVAQLSCSLLLNIPKSQAARDVRFLHVIKLFTRKYNRIVSAGTSAIFKPFNNRYRSKLIVQMID
ncbi:hypothetical protein MTR_2g075890 [Medicago truncatula]|uniref:Uncharacterized protein n=1 Tax=Medicago truncatula TaxID=3880 RepID=G7ITF3_MEDTR|nr:hypothetical protein MTR_2g075890 [Medicago truncatula]